MKRPRLPAVGGYFVATAAVSATSFFAVPLIVRAVGQSEFGRWALLEPLAALLAPCSTLGVTFGIIKQISHDGAAPLPTLRGLVLRVAPFVAVGSAIGFAIARRLSFNTEAALCFALLVFAEALIALLLATFRASGRVLGYGATGVTRGALFLVALALSVWLVPVVHDVFSLVVWRLLAATVAWSVGQAVVRVLRDRAFLAPERRGERIRFRDAVSYGAPILIASVLGLIIEFGDRFVLAAHVSFADIGQYVVHVKVAAILDALLVQPFALWWPTARFEHQRDADGGNRFFAETASLTLAVLLLSGGMLWLLAPAVLPWFAPGVALRSDVLLLLVLALVLRAIATPLNVGGLTPGHTHWNAIGVLAGSVVNLVLCFLLIPPYGILGAAWATIIGYLAYAFGLGIISQRIRHVPFAYSKMAALFAMTIAGCTALARWHLLPSRPQALLSACVFAAVFVILVRVLLGPLLSRFAWRAREVVASAD